MKHSRLFYLPIILIITGCATSEETSIKNDSPTRALLSGDIQSDQYFDALTKANEQSRENEQFEVNRQATRAYNTKTGRIEYLPEDTVQSWNEEEKRWEFTPVTPR